MIEQCKLLVNGKRCVLVAGHRGECVEPEYRRDMSDVIRYRFLSDRYEDAIENLAACEKRLAAVDKLFEIGNCHTWACNHGAGGGGCDDECARLRKQARGA